MKFIRKILLLIASIALFNSAISAETINDKASLNGITEARGVFLIDFTDVKTTAFYLKIIEGTHQGFIKQNVDPDLVLVFIGKTVKYLSTKQD